MPLVVTMKWMHTKKQTYFAKKSYKKLGGKDGK